MQELQSDRPIYWLGERLGSKEVEISETRDEENGSCDIDYIEGPSWQSGRLFYTTPNSQIQTTIIVLHCVIHLMPMGRITIGEKQQCECTWFFAKTAFKGSPGISKVRWSVLKVSTAMWR
jgi:hypothetical protein